MSRRSEKRDEDRFVNLVIGCGLIATVAGYIILGWIAAHWVEVLLVSVGACCCMFAFVPKKGDKHEVDPYSTPAFTPACTPEPEPTALTDAMLKALDWKLLEDLAVEFFKAQGYAAEGTALGADGGIDFHFVNNGELHLGQVKAWPRGRVPLAKVRELRGSMASAKAQRGLFLTNGDYTKDARAFAVEQEITLWDGTLLLQKVNELPDAKREALIRKIFSGDYTTPSCPMCGKKLVLRVGKTEFWGCSGYPRCRGKLQKARRDER